MKFWALLVMTVFLLSAPLSSFAQDGEEAPDYERAQQMFRYYGSADNSPTFRQAFDNKSIIGYHIPVKPLSQEETLVNKYSRLGQSSAKRSNPSTNPYYNNSEVSQTKGPLSLNQYIDGRADVGGTSHRRTYNAQDDQNSLMLSPDQIKRKRAAIQRDRERKEKSAERDRINKVQRSRLQSRSSGASFSSVSNSSSQNDTTQRKRNINIKVYDRHKDATTPLERVYDYGSQ